MRPLAPAAHTLLASATQVAFSTLEVPEVCTAHAVPFHFKMVPVSPTAQTLVALLPCTLRRMLVVPLGCRSICE